VVLVLRLPERAEALSRSLGDESPISCQEFNQKEAGGAEFRCLVVGKVVAAMKRQVKHRGVRL